MASTSAIQGVSVIVAVGSVDGHPTVKLVSSMLI